MRLARGADLTTSCAALALSVSALIYALLILSSMQMA